MTAEAATDRTAALSQLVGDLRRKVCLELPPRQTAAAVATCLRPFLGRADLLTEAQQESDPDEYTQHVLHVEEDGSFSIVSLVWLPGQRTPIHDHVSWCVVGVHAGEETEIRYDVHVHDDLRYLTEAEISVNHVHTLCEVAPPGDIHEVTNTGDEKAISIHVYGADIRRLGSSIRRRYILPIRHK